MTSEAGTSENLSVMRYYKCRSKKFAKTCNKKTIRKEVIEELVVDTTLKVLQGDFLNNLSDEILRVHDSRLEEQTTLKLLLVEKRETTNALNNLMGALEKGIVSRTTQLRLEELEAKLEEIEAKIIVEESKSKIHLTKEDILRFMKKALKKEPYAMVRMLVNKVVLYDDKVEIYYNYIENYKPDDNNHQAFSFYKGYTNLRNSHKTGYVIDNATIQLFV